MKEGAPPLSTPPGLLEVSGMDYGEKRIAYLIACSGALLLLLCILVSYSLVLAIAGVAMMSFAIVMLKAGDWLVLSFSRAGVYPLFSSMKVREDCILVRQGGGFTAVGGFEILTSRSIVELSETERERLLIGWFSFLGSVRHPFKLIATLSPCDVSRELRELTRKLEGVRISLAKAKDQGMESRLLREKEELEKALERLSSEVPYETVFLLTTQAEAETEEKAREKLSSRLRELATAVELSLSAETRRLRGRELLRMLELHIFSPENLENFLF